jgi:hypothetical protein
MNKKNNNNIDTAQHRAQTPHFGIVPSYNNACDRSLHCPTVSSHNAPFRSHYYAYAHALHVFHWVGPVLLLTCCTELRCAALKIWGTVLGGMCTLVGLALSAAKNRVASDGFGATARRGSGKTGGGMVRFFSRIASSDGVAGIGSGAGEGETPRRERRYSITSSVSASAAGASYVLTGVRRSSLRGRVSFQNLWAVPALLSYAVPPTAFEHPSNDLFALFPPTSFLPVPSLIVLSSLSSVSLASSSLSCCREVGIFSPLSGLALVHSLRQSRSSRVSLSSPLFSSCLVSRTTSCIRWSTSLFCPFYGTVVFLSLFRSMNNRTFLCRRKGSNE